MTDKIVEMKDEVELVVCEYYIVQHASNGAKNKYIKYLFHDRWVSWLGEEHDLHEYRPIAMIDIDKLTIEKV